MTYPYEIPLGVLCSSVMGMTDWTLLVLKAMHNPSSSSALGRMLLCVVPYIQIPLPVDMLVDEYWTSWTGALAFRDIAYR